MSHWSTKYIFNSTWKNNSGKAYFSMKLHPLFYKLISPDISYLEALNDLFVKYLYGLDIQI